MNPKSLALKKAAKKTLLIKKPTFILTKKPAIPQPTSPLDVTKLA